jgi:predicted RNA-binding protein with PIN domain
MIPLLMHYLIDAYNLLFRFSKSGGTLKKKRQQMIEEINDVVAHLPFRITLVFDGSAEHFSHSTREHFDAVELVYTPKSTSADDYISTEVIGSPSPMQITVVTNDRDLAMRCRNHRANTLTIHAFLHLLTKKKAQKKRRFARPPRAFTSSSSEFTRLLLLFEKKMLDELSGDFRDEEE